MVARSPLDVNDLGGATPRLKRENEASWPRASDIEEGAREYGSERSGARRPDRRQPGLWR